MEYLGRCESASWAFWHSTLPRGCGTFNGAEKETAWHEIMQSGSIETGTVTIVVEGRTGPNALDVFTVTHLEPAQIVQ